MHCVVRHPGMNKAEMLELIGELELADARETMEEEVVEVPGGGGAGGLSLEECQALLRAHFGVGD